MAFLELQGIHKGYGADPSAVLRDVDLAIEQGELVAVVGRSGIVARPTARAIATSGERPSARRRSSIIRSWAACSPPRPSHRPTGGQVRA